MYYHTLDPVILQLGAFRLNWFSILILLSLLAVWILARRVAKHHRTEWAQEEINDLMILVFIGLVLGARIGYILLYTPSSLLSEPWILFMLWQGGLSLHGVLVGIAVAMFLFARRSHKNVFQVAELILPLLPIVLLAIHLGDFINGDQWGRLTEQPWAVVFPRADLQPRHPVQLYQAFTQGVLLFALMWWLLLKNVHCMALSGAFLTAFGLLDIINEFFRAPLHDLAAVAADGLRLGQMFSLPVVLAGLILIYLATRSEKGNSAV
ncbi:MAG: prolipoprotein diacylglyceryl transferase [Gammaproteobacteria bacterium]|nr:prolipoprotein diacylglyceryl transferase [Gammaproteobacteria bacterium]